MNQRQLFEHWLDINGKPADRWPVAKNLGKFSGHYKDSAVQLAWEAWLMAIAMNEKGTEETTAAS